MPMKPPSMKVYTTKSTEGRVERKGIPSMAKPKLPGMKPQIEEEPLTDEEREQEEFCHFYPHIATGF